MTATMRNELNTYLLMNVIPKAMPLFSTKLI